MSWYMCPHCRQWHHTDFLVTNQPCPATKDSVVVARDDEGKWHFVPRPPQREDDYEKVSGTAMVGTISGYDGTASVPLPVGTVEASPGVTCSRCGAPLPYGGRYCSKCSFDMFYASGL